MTAMSVIGGWFSGWAGGRFAVPAVFSVAITTGLFWLMATLIGSPKQDFDAPEDFATMDIVDLPPDEPEQEQAAEAAPPPPPPTAAALEPLPGIPVLARPQIDAPELPDIDFELDINIETPNVTSSLSPTLTPSVSNSALNAVLAGAALGSGLGTGAGGGGFSGRKLIPISTGAPQIPKYAYDNQIDGWVEVLFVVDARGQVRNIRIIDANPKGVFETAAVDAVRSWQYDQKSIRGGTFEVQQRLEFKWKDFTSNWR